MQPCDAPVALARVACFSSKQRTHILSSSVTRSAERDLTWASQRISAPENTKIGAQAARVFAI